MKLQTPEKIKTEERIGLGSGSDVENELVVITPRRRQSVLDLSPGVKAGMTPKLRTLNAVSPTLALRRRSSGTANVQYRAISSGGSVVTMMFSKVFYHKPIRDNIVSTLPLYDACHEKTDLKVFDVVIPEKGWARVAVPIHPTV